MNRNAHIIKEPHITKRQMVLNDLIVYEQRFALYINLAATYPPNLRLMFLTTF